MKVMRRKDRLVIFTDKVTVKIALTKEGARRNLKEKELSKELVPFISECRKTTRRGFIGIFDGFRPLT